MKMKATASRAIRPSPTPSPGASDSCAANTAGRCGGWHQGGGFIPTRLGNRTLRALQVLLLTSLPAVAAGPDWQWREDPGRSLELRRGEVLVARFLVDPQPADPHFDVLATPDGRNLVWVAPPDHAWHYGHWFSWKMINEVNFWETNPNTGESVGRCEVGEVKIKTAARYATVRFRCLFRLPGNDAPVLEDRVEVRITPKPAGPQVDWSFTTTALADVTLGRTPLPGEPNGVPWGGYGGLSWRGAKDLKEVRFLDSEGRSGMDIHRQHARWADVRGTLDDKPAGLAILDHPANPGHPTSWFIVAEPPMRFWYFNPALVQPKPIELAKGRSFTHRYRVIVHDGTWTPQRLNDEAAAFAH